MNFITEVTRKWLMFEVGETITKNLLFVSRRIQRFSRAPGCRSWGGQSWSSVSNSSWARLGSTLSSCRLLLAAESQLYFMKRDSRCLIICADFIWIWLIWLLTVEFSPWYYIQYDNDLLYLMHYMSLYFMTNQTVNRITPLFDQRFFSLRHRWTCWAW